MNLRDREQREIATVVLGAAILVGALAGGSEMSPDEAINRAAEYIETVEQRFPTKPIPNRPPRKP